MRNLSIFKSSGFTLIEVLVVVSLLSILLVIGSINLFSPSQEARLDSTSTDVVSLLREAQNKAMNTDTQGDPTSDEFGIHFDSQTAALFKGSTFASGDPNNFVVEMPSTISVSPNLPCPAPPDDCNNIVFQRISGEVVGFNDSQNNVCITESSSGKNVLISVNFVGVANVQDGC